MATFKCHVDGDTPANTKQRELLKLVRTMVREGYWQEIAPNSYELTDAGKERFKEEAAEETAWARAQGIDLTGQAGKTSVMTNHYDERPQTIKIFTEN